MAHQIIRQPNGLFGVFSSDVEAWLIYDATEDELITFYMNEAALEAKRKTQNILRQVIAGTPENIYHQSTLTFDEANEAHNEHGEPVPFANL